MVVALTIGFVWQGWASYMGYNVSATHSISKCCHAAAMLLSASKAVTLCCAGSSIVQVCQCCILFGSEGGTQTPHAHAPCSGSHRYCSSSCNQQVISLLLVDVPGKCTVRLLQVVLNTTVLFILQLVASLVLPWCLVVAQLYSGQHQILRHSHLTRQVVEC